MRRQIEIPDVLYHITDPLYLDSILKEGLIPHRSRGASFEGDPEDKSKYGVYLASSYRSILAIDDDFSYYDEYVVLKIDVRDLKDSLIPDEAYDMGYEFTEEELEQGLYDQSSWRYPGVISKDRILDIIKSH